MENDLFETDKMTAERLRDSGIDQAVKHADMISEKWSDRAYEVLKGYLNVIGFNDFMAEDVRAYSAGLLPKPPSGRAWGAVILRASRAGLVVMAGYGRTTNPNAHRTPAAIWRKK